MAGLLLTSTLLLGASGSAWAGDPIMPLSQVHGGMSCTGYSVLQGTTISSFAVGVVDVVAGSAGSPPSILIRVSGPAVDITGVGPGFSGSPIYCPDGQGVQRNIGAIAQGVGDYGNKLALATPIEAILGEPVLAPIAARRSRAHLTGARRLPEPLAISGISGSVASLFERAAARAGRILYAVPGATRAAYAPQTLRPGSSVAAGLSSGDIGSAAIGTVAYTDGDAVWAFGHPLDSAGPRSLLLQDAYVYTIVNTPLPTADNPGSYKLAAPGHDLGTISNDGLAAIVGRVGALPPRFPLRVNARSLDSGAALTSNSEIVDESAVGLPTGVSSLALVGPIAVAQAAENVLHGSPPQQSGRLCLQVRLRELKDPLGFCNNYVIDGASAGGGALLGAGATPYLADVGQALDAIDSFKLGLLHITGAQVSLDLGHGVRQGFMLAGRALGVAHRGGTVRLLLTIQVVRGPRITKAISIKIPRQLGTGRRTLKLTGTDADGSGGAGQLADVVAILGGDSGGDSSTGGPRTVADLARQVAAIQRFDGVSARFGAARAAVAAAPPGGGRRPKSPGSKGGAGTGGPSRASHPGVPVYRDPSLRLSGTITIPLTVR